MMVVFPKSILFCITSLLLVVSVGCGNNAGPKSGVVRFLDGSPVQSGSIEFRSKASQQRFSSRIKHDGAFQPADEKGNIGLPPDAYDVVVVQIVLTEDLAKEAHTHGQTVPRRYADYYTSGLTVDVQDGQTEPITVELESE